ncbi:MAG: hypothetical protein A2958_00700 [Candidatus Levybacteria bacterium RIFCSPLOWO2_01_FULL_38_13]|nr:MAG: hypothetical protein A2958_00700 [Candidatus Levybacteria bacterium RIFCSPLOWO2_01_FULL_38_13]
MTAQEIIGKYIKFFEKRGHKRIPNSPLVLQNDPTTLFTSSGMQPLVPYFLGEKHPQGKRLVNVQNCFRAADIDEVGDDKHTTFFRMLGNWSLGDYFKKEQLPWYWEFLTKVIGLPKEKLYITVFEGFSNTPKDIESEKIWTEILENEGLDSKKKIFSYGADKNWWSRSGVPDDMPEGEPGGPDSEVFYFFENVKHDPKFGTQCHPNCQCGRFLEIGNSVFMEYQKTKNGFKPLPNKNVDFGGGAERLLAAVENKNDIFETRLFSPVIDSIEKITAKNYKKNKKAMQVIADHIIAAVFITDGGITPSNKEQGYVLRRLLRRAIRYGKQLEASETFTAWIASSVIENYSDTDSQLMDRKKIIIGLFTEEEEKFNQAIREGLKISEKIFLTRTPIVPEEYSKIMQIPNKKEFFRNIFRKSDFKETANFLSGFGVSLTKADIGNATISGNQAFDLYQSFGFPIEMVTELAQEKRLFVDIEDFKRELKRHQKVSRKGAGKKFAGGLADHSGKTIMGHTATHLLHQALRDVLGNSVYQTGSNITSERIRFDFAYDKKLTDDEIEKVEKIINKKIEENLPVHFEIMTLDKAKEIGAIGLFDEKYEDKVKVYFIGPSTHSAASGQPHTQAYSVEFCGGPHVNFTGLLKRFKIIKQENIGHGQRRVYATIKDV